MTSLTPRCQHCGLALPIWRLVPCKDASGHSSRTDIGIFVACSDECCLAAGHHGEHKEPA